MEEDDYVMVDGNDLMEPYDRKKSTGKIVVLVFCEALYSVVFVTGQLSQHGRRFRLKQQATAGTYWCMRNVSTAGVGVQMMVLGLESCGRMNSVDKKEEMIWWHWNKSGTCVSTVFCHCGSCFVLELLNWC